MKRRRRIATTMIFALAGLVGTAEFAQAWQSRTIRFAKGRTSKTVSGKTRPDTPECWTFVARRGQTATATITSGSAAVLVLDPFAEGSEYDDLQLQIQERGLKRDRLFVDRTGSQDVCVTALDNGSYRYRFTLSIR
jgi:hypothetical protein